ncbi:MAG: nucleotide sugar dehydrogenase [Halioglobus sp.]
MNNTQQQLIDKLQAKTAKIGIVGLGYVGLPLCLRYAEAGYSVLGFDISETKVETLNDGRSYFRHYGHELVATARDQGFKATTDFALASDVDALILCVPTPLNEHRDPDISFVTRTMDSLLPHLHSGQVVSLESTTYPGTTEEELRPRIESAGLTIGESLFLVYSPEREDPGNKNFSTRTIPKVVGGSTAECLAVGVALYENVIDTVVPVSSTEVAEMSKLLENIHRAVNIGLVNEMKVVADKMGIDIYEVIDAAATKPFGFVPYYPGPGLGGHCIPIDPFYLTWKAKEYGVNTRFIELAGEVNSNMPNYVVSKVAAGLNDHSKAVRGSAILVLGIAYKPNVDDMRESPSAEILQLLVDLGANVDYSDPFVPSFPQMRQYEFDLTSVELTAESLAHYDCVVLATDHDAFDYDFVHQHANLIVDSRGRYRECSEKVVKA